MKLALTIGGVFAAPLDFRTTNTISNTLNSDQCNVFQAGELTLIQCPNAFEVYPTADLALEPYALENSGSSGYITSVKKSREED